MPFAEINGQRVRFDDSGGDGPPVMLSHGFLMDREMFAPQVEALSPEFRVITWDHVWRALGSSAGSAIVNAYPGSFPLIPLAGRRGLRRGRPGRELAPADRCTASPRLP